MYSLRGWLRVTESVLCRWELTALLNSDCMQQAATQRPLQRPSPGLNFSTEKRSLKITALSVTFAPVSSPVPPSHFYHWRELPQVSFLSRQKYACCDKTFVATKLCLSQQNITKIMFVATNVCGNKSFVATKHEFCRDKHVFDATKMILAAAPQPQTPSARNTH